MKASEVSYNLAGSVRHLGLPVSGVTVVLFEYWRLSSGLLKQLIARHKTGPRGEYSFSVKAGTYYLEVIPDQSTRFVRHTVEDVRVAGNTACNIALSTGVILSGRVRTADGIHLSQCRVVAVAAESSYRATERPDDRGDYNLVLPRGKYYLTARFEAASGEQDTVYGQREKPFITTNFELIDLERDQKKDIALPHLPELTGRVTDSSGAPVANAAVSLTPSINEDNVVLVDLRVRTIAYTGTDGRFTILAQPGLYDVLVQPPEGVPVCEVREKGVSIETALTRDFTLPAGKVLSGHVLCDGEPIRGCLVKVHGPDGKVAMSATGSEGDFTLHVPPGSFDLSVVGQPDLVGRAANVGISPWTRNLIVSEDITVTVELKNGVAVAGKVADSSGKPRPRVRISACADKERAFVPDDLEHPVATTMTAEDGSFCLSLTPGTYWISLNDDPQGARRVEVKDDPVQLNLTWTAGFVVRFEVLTEADEPVSKCKVLFEPYSQMDQSLIDGSHAARRPAPVTGFTVTGDNGVCQVTLPGGIYSFRFNPPHHSPYQAKAIRQISIGTDTERKVVLSLKKDPAADEAQREPDNASEVTPVS